MDIFFLSFNITLYKTLGDVVIISISNSLVILSKTISRCSNPKKPHLKPNPNAWELSCSICRAESFNFNL
ncbi:MAG: hypothetical protein AMS24_03140 [Chlamydiae bacterium SM23_39]|nr:MAG: hypothetical protein AMS24_03140 [Chlamydiae bacterium SM23_39]